jgi:hypothetical protein
LGWAGSPGMSAAVIARAQAFGEFQWIRFGGDAVPNLLSAVIACPTHGAQWHSRPGGSAVALPVSGSASPEGRKRRARGFGRNPPTGPARCHTHRALLDDYPGRCWLRGVTLTVMVI